MARMRGLALLAAAGTLTMSAASTAQADTKGPAGSGSATVAVYGLGLNVQGTITLGGPPAGGSLNLNVGPGPSTPPKVVVTVLGGLLTHMSRSAHELSVNHGRPIRSTAVTGTGSSQRARRATAPANPAAPATPAAGTNSSRSAATAALTTANTPIAHSNAVRGGAVAASPVASDVNAPDGDTLTPILIAGGLVLLLGAAGTGTMRRRRIGLPA